MINLIIDLFRRKIVRDQKARWNYQYARGQWEGLKDDLELERQEVIKDYFLKYTEGAEPNMIEFGCGYGVLPEVIFKKQHYSHYIGVDVSDFVINEIQTLSDAKTAFVVGDLDTYVFQERFDVIVFNECINYSKNIPLLIARCINEGLKKGGIFIISVHTSKRSKEIWGDLHRSLVVLEAKTIKNERSLWQVEVLKPN